MHGRGSRAGGRDAVAVSAHEGLALHAGADGHLEALAEVAREEGVDDGIEARVDVGEEEEGLAHGLEVAVVQLMQVAPGRQHVVDQDGAPAQREEQQHHHQHAHHLQRHHQQHHSNVSMMLIRVGPQHIAKSSTIITSVPTTCNVIINNITVTPA